MRGAAIAAIALTLAGCTIWSKRYDRFDLDVDGPGAVTVRVEGTDGPRVALAAGDEAASSTFQYGTHEVTFSRSTTDGVRIACTTCMGPMILVGPTGRIFGSHGPRTATIEPGSTLVVRRPYYLVRVHEWERDWWGSTVWFRSSQEGVLVQLEADWSRVRRVEAFQQPARGLGWVLIGASSLPLFTGLVMLGEPETRIPGAALLGASIFINWTGWRTALRSARIRTLHEGSSAGTAGR